MSDSTLHKNAHSSAKLNFLYRPLLHITQAWSIQLVVVTINVHIRYLPFLKQMKCTRFLTVTAIRTIRCLQPEVAFFSLFGVYSFDCLVCFLLRMRKIDLVKHF